jgi:hypothetical protein
MIHSFVDKDKFELESIDVDRTISRDVKWHMHISREIYQKSNGLHQLPTKPSKLPTLYPPPPPLSHPHRSSSSYLANFSTQISEISRPISSYERPAWFSSTLWLSTIHFRPRLSTFNTALSDVEKTDLQRLATNEIRPPAHLSWDALLARKLLAHAAGEELSSLYHVSCELK